MLRIPVTLHEARVLQSALEVAKRESHKPAEVAAYATLAEKLNVYVPQPKKR